MKSKVNHAGTGNNLTVVIIYDPSTNEEESVVVEDYEYGYGDSPFLSLDRYTLAELDALYDAPIDPVARRAWLHYHGVISVGDSVVVVRGRKYPLGTRGLVTGFWDYRDAWGRPQTRYASLDTGISVSINNLALAPITTP